MKKTLLLISVACLSLTVHATPNNAPSTNTNSMVPQNFNWGNNRGSNWNVPNFNMGNNRSGSNWNMPNMNWGSGNGRGSSFNMPNMNWGSGNGRGSSFNMPNMNWGNKGGNNWNMPRFNTGSNNVPGNWAPRQNYNNYVQPNRAMQQPRAVQPPRAPQPQRTFQQPRAAQAPLAPRQKPIQAKAPQPSIATQTDNSGFPPETMNQASPANVAPKAQISNPATKIPKPSEVKGIFLAPENRTK